MDREEIAEMHRPILAALRARDPSRAGAAMRDHLIESSPRSLAEEDAR